MKLFTRSILLICLCFSAFFAKASASAHFTADVTSGCAPLLVHFTNTTTGASGSATYSWDLGNGTTSTLTDVSGSYIAAGTYTCTLTVTDGGVTTTYSMTITVFPAPTVDFVASDTAVCPGSTVSFTSTTLAGVPGALTYAWAFGDGHVSTSSSPSDLYSAPGYYNVTLSATNSDGCVASLTKTAYIHVYTPPVAAFTAPTVHFCGTPAHAVFTDASTGTGPFTYHWSFGDGSTGSGSPASHDYTSTGSYTVKLIVTDAHGCQDSISMPAYIYVGITTASFTGPTTACVHSSVTFTNTSTSHISSEWKFGDGNIGFGDPGTNIYSTPGTYTVKLIVSDGYCQDSVIHTIVIQPGPVTSFTITPSEPCPPPTAITFTGTVPSGATTTWLYGDGSAGAGLPSTHTYPHMGVDTVKMVVVDPATGCTDTIQKTLILYDIVPELIALPTSGCAPLTVSFKDSLYTHEPNDTLLSYPLLPHYPYAITGYTWTFGDGSASSTSGTPSHTYTATGSYTVHVTMTTANGCTVLDSTVIHVGKPPVVTFSVTPTHACYHDNSETFTVTIISGPADHYTWEFGDGEGETDSVLTATHSYSLPGIYSVTLTAFYNGCPSAPVIMPNLITIDSPKAIIADSVFCSPAKRVLFTDHSLGDDTHIWLFGDGGTSTTSPVTHDYASFTTYVVTLATYNVRSGCRDTAVVSVDLSRPIPYFSTPDTAICRDSFMVFTPTVTLDSSVSYHWSDFGHGSTMDSLSQIFIDTFHATGIYNIRLVIQDQNGCSDTVVKANYIHIAKPVANFTAAPPTGCVPATVIFTDHSTDIAGTTYTSYAWDFGDGISAVVSSSPVSHTYTSAGSFTTTEIVKDNIGCMDTVALSLVTVYQPSASFNASNVFPCTNDPVLFTNTSSTIVSSYWFFGDGDTSTANSPTHTYTSAGVYTVKLVVTDANGCTDTASYPAYINVSKPVASFTMDDSVSICPPLTVHFTNTSSGAVDYSWFLGDGSTSVAADPSDLYIFTGLDTVMLIAVNMYGCTDTAIGHVNLLGYAGSFSYTPDSGCAPLSVHFSASLGNVPSIIWDFADGITSSSSALDTITHVYTIPGAYLPKLILSDNSGCQNSSKGLDTIKVDGVIPGFTTAPNPACQGSTFLLRDTSASYWSKITTWNWTFNGNTSTIDSPSFTINTAGTYPATLTVVDGWGCTANVSENVIVYPPPVITTIPDTTICIGDAATLVGYGGVSYTWSPPATLSCTACNPSLASPTVVTTYTVIGTDAHGCVNTDTVTVSLKTKTISVARGDTEICQGVIVQIFDSGGTKYTWIPGTALSSPTVADPFAEPAVTTDYMVIAQLGSCIPDTNYVNIIVHPLPSVNAGPDQTLLAGTPAQLATSGNLIYRYWWDNTNSLSCDSCANPIATMSVTTTYVVTVATDFGCTNDDSVTIHLYCDVSQVFIPNSFTPNGDGENDVFYPRGKGVSRIKSFRIYNRWGEKLFERNDIDINDKSNAWDGSYMGGAPRPDVYVYIIDATCETGEPINLKGDVTIIR